MSHLSTAANAFAVVGLADVILRAGTQLYDLLSRTSTASKNSTRLLSALESLTATIKDVQRFAHRFNTSQFVLEDGRTLPIELETILKDCESELKELKGIVAADTTGVNGGWMIKCRNIWVFALYDREILRSCQMLEAHKTALIAVLMVNSSENDIALRNESGRVRTDISDLRRAADTGFQRIKQDIAGSSSTTHRGVEKVTSLVRASTQDTKRHLQKISISIDKQSHTLCRQSAATDSRMANIEDATASIKNYLATLTLTQTETKDILVEGRGLQNIIIPLTLMQSNLAKAVQMLAREGSMEISQHDADWIQEELANLLASAHERAARSLRRRQSRAELYSSREDFALYHCPSAQRIINYPESRSLHNQAKSYGDQVQPDHEEAILFQYRTSSKTPVGLLAVESKVRSTGCTEPGKCYRSLEFRFVCMPRRSVMLGQTGVIGVFSHQWVIGASQPKITRFVRVVNVVPRNSEAFQCIKKNDIKALRKLFMNKSASPYDYSESGRSLLCEAALFLHFESVELLLEVGADPHNCYLGASPLNDLSYVLWRFLRVCDITTQYKAVLRACPRAAQAVLQGFNFSLAKIPKWHTGETQRALTLLLRQRGEELEITETIVEEMEYDPVACMALLQILQGCDIKIRVTVAAMQKFARTFDKGLMMMLLDQAGVKITEAVLEMAARNYAYGKGVIILLLERGGTAIKITGKLVKAVAQSFDKELMMLLLDQWGTETSITEELLEATTTNEKYGKEVMMLLLGRSGTAVQISEKLVKSVAQSFDKELMLLLLDRRDTETSVTEELLEATTTNKKYGKEVMMLLLERSSTAVQISEKLVKSVAQSFDKELVTLLLNRRGTKVSITEELLEAATTNREYGKEVMMLLLERSGTAVTITEKLVKAVAQSFDKEMIMHLLDRKGTEVKITEEILDAAAANNRCSWEITIHLLAHKEKEDEIVEASEAVANGMGAREMERRILAQEGRGSETIEEISGAAVAKRMMVREMWRRMLAQEGMESALTEAPSQAAATKRMMVREMWERILVQEGIESALTEAPSEAAVMKRMMVREVWRWILAQEGIESAITEALLEVAVENTMRRRRTWRSILAQKAQKLGVIGITSSFLALV